MKNNVAVGFFIVNSFCSTYHARKGKARAILVLPDRCPRKGAFFYCQEIRGLTRKSIRVYIFS